MHEAHERALEALARRKRLRSLAPRLGVDFASNDYLGLAGSAELAACAVDAIARGVPAGSGGSRLLRGNHPEHEALEEEAAMHFGAQTAMFFGGGFAANSAMFATLPQRGDLVVHDEFIHASVHDGLRMGKAGHVAALHNDSNSFDTAIKAWRGGGGTGRPWIAVESLYSMDGDCAPLTELAEVARRHEGMLIIDEAHATGVLGQNGRGLGSLLEGREDVVTLHTCGKALGVMGALVCAPRTLRDYLINRCRPFIYATAPSPLVAALVRASLRLCRDNPQRRVQLAKLVALAGKELEAQCAVKPSGTHIQPIIAGADDRALSLSAAMQQRGFDIRAVRPPTVPEGTARLRVSLTLNATADDITNMVRSLADELRQAAA